MEDFRRVEFRNVEVGRVVISDIASPMGLEYRKIRPRFGESDEPHLVTAEPLKVGRGVWIMPHHVVTLPYPEGGSHG